MPALRCRDDRRHLAVVGDAAIVRGLYSWTLMLARPDLQHLQHPDRARIPAFVRTQSVLRASLAETAGRTGPARVHEAGALRLRFPRVGGACEGIILNTSGGIAGGDRQSLSFAAEAGARAAITTQSAEKVYRSDGDVAHVETNLELAAGADLAWLPQETILFDTARLSRRIDVAMAATATLTIREGVVFGRAARGERYTRGALHDRWRIRRDGRLILAEDVRLDGDIAAVLDRAALGRGAAAIATIVHVAPDAAAHLDNVREAFDDAGCDAGASAWNGMLVVRLAGRDASKVRGTGAKILARLLPNVSPRIWSC
jgi:urease accessory protein